MVKPGLTVLQVIPELDAGGAERTTLEITQALVKAGCRSIVVSQGGRMEAELA
ncbi:MAG TPA: glycosyl transferase, partial [Hyphomonadaceae bacterium]|nr:glycosyl transferase [Hyphomonadaceae bacterium]